MITALVVLATAIVFQADSPPRLLDRGDMSNVGDAAHTIARTADEWSALWRRHAPERPQPNVDFTKEMVAAVFLGTRATAGFSVEILGTREEAGALVVRYRERRPGPGLVVAQVITSAYTIAALPRHDGAVKFEKVE